MKGVDLIEQARHCCDHIATAAALLETHGNYPGAEIIGDNVIACTGSMIASDIDKLRALIDALDPMIVKNSRKRERL